MKLHANSYEFLDKAKLNTLDSLKLIYENTDISAYTGYNRDRRTYIIDNKNNEKLVLLSQEDDFRKLLVEQGVLQKIQSEGYNYKLSELDLCTLISNMYYFASCASGIRSSLAQWLSSNKCSNTRYLFDFEEKDYIRACRIYWLNSQDFLLILDDAHKQKGDHSCISAIAYIDNNIETEGCYMGLLSKFRDDDNNLSITYSTLDDATIIDLDIPKLDCISKYFGNTNMSPISGYYDICYFKELPETD